MADVVVNGFVYNARTLFVRGVPAPTTPDIHSELLALLEQHGPFSFTGGKHGFAFVVYETDEAAQSAIATLHGSLFHGQYLCVQVAEPRPGKKGPGGLAARQSSWKRTHDGEVYNHPHHRPRAFYPEYNSTSSPSPCPTLLEDLRLFEEFKQFQRLRSLHAAAACAASDSAPFTPAPWPAVQPPPPPPSHTHSPPQASLYHPFPAAAAAAAAAAASPALAGGALYNQHHTAWHLSAPSHARVVLVPPLPPASPDYIPFDRRHARTSYAGAPWHARQQHQARPRKAPATSTFHFRSGSSNQAFTSTSAAASAADTDALYEEIDMFARRPPPEAQGRRVAPSSQHQCDPLHPSHAPSFPDDASDEVMAGILGGDSDNEDV